MLPEHGHIHISSPALFITMMFIAAIVAIIVAAIVSVKRDRRRAEAMARSFQTYPQHNAMTRDGHWPAAPDTYTHEPFSTGKPVTTTVLSDPPRFPPRPVYPAQPAVFGGPVAYGPGYGMDPSLALVEGMLIGEALGSHHDHTTVINEGPTTTYVDSSPSYSSPSYDSGSSFDWGSSSSSFDSSSSSGGFDASW